MKTSIIYDLDGWAWCHKARALSRYLPGAMAVAECDLPLRAQGAAICLSPKHYRRLAHRLDPALTLVGASAADEVWELADLAHRVAGIFVSSARLATPLRASGLSPFVCANGVDADIFRPATEPRIPARHRLTVAYVGPATTPRDGRESLAGYEIVSRAAMAAGVALIAHDTIGDETGRRYWSQVRVRDRIYHRADVLAVAGDGDAAQTAALEAMACGVPVLGSPIGNLPELVSDGHNGYLIDPGIESFACLFSALDADPRRLPEMGRHARATVETAWAWRHRADDFRRMMLACLPLPKAAPAPLPIRATV